MEEEGIRVNLTAKNEHVPEVERQNRVIKERARAIFQTLPYQHVPRKIRISLIQYVTFWLNNIPKAGQQYSPRDLVFGEQKIDYNLICQLPFGAYVQVHDDLDITNTMQSRTTGAINLGVTGSIQGTHKFFSLNTGEIIVRRKWTELPVPNEVINRLEELTVEEVESGSKNEMCELNEAEDDDEEEEQQQGEEIREDTQTEYTGVENENEYNEGGDANGIVHDEPIRNVNTGGTIEVEEEIVENDHEANEGNNNGEDNNGRYNLQSNGTRDYLHRFIFVSVKAGLTKWGDKARKAVLG
jgi:hypothetical protein